MNTILMIVIFTLSIVVMQIAINYSNKKTKNKKQK